MLNPAGSYVYLLAYIVVLYLRPHEYLPALQGVPVIPVLLLLAFGMWLLLHPKDFEAPQFGLVLGLGLAMTLSVALTGWVGGAFKTFMDFVPTAMLFFLVATSVDSLARLRAIVLTISGLAAVIAVHGVGQITSEQGTGWTGAATIAGRITYLGLFNDPNDLAMVFLIALPLTLCLARVTDSMVLRPLCWIAAGLVAYGIFLCNSRGAMLAVAAMLLVWGIRRYGWVGGVCIGPLLLVPFVLLGPSRVGEMTVDEESAAGRIDAWYAGFEMFRSHPVFGVGKGLFSDHHELTAHNSFVLAIAELGVVGYFFWLSLLVMSALMLHRLLRAAAPRPAPGPLPPASPTAFMPLALPDAVPAWSELRHFALALMYSLIGALVSAFFLSRTYVVVLYLLLALIVAVFGIARAGWPDRVEPILFGEWTVTIVVLEALSIAALWGVTRVMLGLM